MKSHLRHHLLIRCVHSNDRQHLVYYSTDKWFIAPDKWLIIAITDTRLRFN